MVYHIYFLFRVTPAIDIKNFGLIISKYMAIAEPCENPNIPSKFLNDFR